MRKLQHLLYMLLVGMAITAFTACSDDDDYQPAQKVAEDNMGAYFAAANAASEVLTPEEYAARPKVDLKVKRQNTKGDVSIPVVVDKADAVFKVPAAVEFKDGESEATLSVDCPGIQALQSYQFSIHLDEAATNPYVKVDGSPVFSYTVMVARWVKVVENATPLDNGKPSLTGCVATALAQIMNYYQYPEKYADGTKIDWNQMLPIGMIVFVYNE